MTALYRDRRQAGVHLARRLREFAHRPATLVLALPRGGVPVAHAVAAALGLPLDVLVVRKLGVPGNDELAFGALASGEGRILNPDVVIRHHVSDAAIGQAVARESAELHHRERRYRGDRPAPDLRRQTVILVDDGIATGATARAALQAVRLRGAARVVVATPLIFPEALAGLRREGCEVVAIPAPAGVTCVGQGYDDFAPTSDEEVMELLADRRLPAIAPAGAQFSVR